MFKRSVKKALLNAINQSKRSRLMRLALVLWLIWVFISVILSAGILSFGIYFNDNETILMGFLLGLSFVPVGALLWFVAGSIRWILSPTE